MKRLLISGLCIVVLIGVAGAQQTGDDQALPKGFKTTPVLKSTQTASKMPIEYPKGKAEIISVIGELEPGGRTALHQHPVPVFVYVLDGTLTVQAQGAEPRDYKPGQAFLEDVNHWHQALNKTSAPVKILVVFAGEEGKPTTITAK
ncbi:MAG: cupin domain-containing protein [Candidatus Rokuibacteriota bacterium]